MAYCAYKGLAGQEVVVYHPDPNHPTALIGVLDGVGDTALGLKDWKTLDLETYTVGELNEGTVAINKRFGFRRIALASEDLSAMRERVSHQLNNLRQVRHNLRLLSET